MNETRRHHYVPQLLLSEFTDKDGTLFFLDNCSQTPVMKKSGPINLFVKRDLYKHVGKLIDVTTDVEEQFGKIETLFAPIHQDIIKSIRKGNTPKIGSHKKSILIEFIVAQWRRTLDQKNRMRETASDIVARRIKSAKQEIEMAHGPLTPEEEEYVGLKAQEEYVELLQLNGMASLSPNIQSQLQQREFHYLRVQNDELSFVVGSNPVIWYQDMDRPIPDGQVKDVFLAISSDIALKLVEGSRGSQVVNLFDGDLVQEWNEKIRDQSHMIAGHSEPLIRSLFRR